MTKSEHITTEMWVNTGTGERLLPICMPQSSFFNMLTAYAESHLGIKSSRTINVYSWLNSFCIDVSLDPFQY